LNINRKLKIFKCALKSGATPFASLFVTRRCNLKCGICAIQDHPAGELPADRWEEAIRRLAAVGVRNMTFTGGEPFLRDDIGELIRFASVQQECITWLFSNLTLVTEKRLAEVKGLDFLCASVDRLDGPEGKTYSRAMKVLEQCAGFGITPAILATVTRDNAREALELAEKAAESGVLFDFALVQNVGGLFSPDRDVRRPDAEALEPVLNRLSDLRARTSHVLPSYKLLKEAAEFYGRNNWKCPVDKDPFIAVNSDGKLMVCLEFATDLSIFEIGSLRDPRWRAAKAAVVDRCRGCSWTCNYQKTFRNPFDLLQESVALLKF